MTEFEGDYDIFVTFLTNCVEDKSFENSFRTHFERAPTAAAHRTIRAVLRFNNRVRRVLDEAGRALSLVDGTRTPLSAVLAAVREFGIQSIEAEREERTCDLCGENVLTHTVSIRGAPGLEWYVRSDFAQVIRCYNVLSHVVDCTTERITRERGDFCPKRHFADLQFCLGWVKALITTCTSRTESRATHPT
jgi:hypothetical protein